MLYSNAPYNNIDFLDLTWNELAKEPKCFIDILKHVIVPFKSIEELNLVDNGFDSKIVSLIKKVVGSTIGRIYLNKI